MQVINSSLNTHKVPVLLRKTTWGKWERRSSYSAFWEFNYFFSYTGATTLKTPVFAIGVNRSTRGHDPALDMGFTLVWCCLSLVWNGLNKLFSSNISDYMLCCGCVLYSGHWRVDNTRSFLFNERCWRLLALYTKMLNMIVEHELIQKLISLKNMN